MSQSSTSVTTFRSQRAVHATVRQQEHETSSAATTQPSNSTNVIVPSNIINSLTGGPYLLGATQDGRQKDSSDTKNDFNVRDIAFELQKETTRILERSTSVSIGALNRSRATGKDTRGNDFSVSGPQPEFRKTSLNPNYGSSYRRQLGPRDINTGRNVLPTVVEARAENHIRGATSNEDYFGHYSFGQRIPELGNVALKNPEAVYLNDRTPSRHGLYGLGSRAQSNDASSGQVNPQRSRRGTASSSRKASVIPRAASIVLDTVEDIKETIRRSSIYDVYETAKKRGAELQRSKPAMLIFEYLFYLVLVAFVYFVLIGLPIWKGAVYWLYWVFQHKFAIAGTWSITIGIAAFYAYSPLFIFFEEDPPMPANLENIDPSKTPGVYNTALMIPCYKSANIIGPTLVAATKIFPPSHIFVISNGNSPTPLDNTEEVCRPFGVNHVWSPVGSKIVAQFVGCYAARGFKNVLLIDDDCALPPNFPIVSERMTNTIKCIGYTIKSVGPESSKGTLCQQAQDLEYKISGIQRALAGKIGSATFPHGAISLWDREFLIQTFYQHPGFSVSEDWFFGHVARQLGSRITMCTSVFIETETPNAVFFSSGGARGGFGEMTIFKQRFLRWNFFFVNGLYYNLAYILLDWNLGLWELGAKVFVFQEVYETLLYLLTPFVLPISIIVRAEFFGWLFAGTFVLYFLNVVIFNELHLRLKKERVSSMCLYVYYMPYKIVLTLINVGSCYWSLYKYARYFARRHPKIVEDEKAVDIVLKMEETHEAKAGQGRRMTITAVGAQVQGSMLEQTATGGTNERRMTVTTLGAPLAVEPMMSPVLEQPEQFGPAIRLQGERVSFGSSRGTSSEDFKIERLPKQSFEGESPGGRHYSRSLSPVKNSSGLKLSRSRSSDRRSNVSPLELVRNISSESTRSNGRSPGRSVISRRSGSSHRSESVNGRSDPVDAATLGFEELMDRLAVIEARLNLRTVQSVEVAFEEDQAPEVPEFPAIIDTIGNLDDTNEYHEDYELEDFNELEKEDSRKTDDAKSMV